MKKWQRVVLTLAGLAVVGVSTAACSTVNTAPDQQALHYSGGSFSSQKWVACVTPGTRQVNGSGDHYYYYPVGQRTYDFTGGAGSDNAPFSSATKDPLDVTVAGTVTFTLNVSCEPFTDKSGKKWPGGLLQKFHETIGNKKWDGEVAYSTEGNTEPGKGWDAMLDRYIGQEIDLAIDNETLKRGWQELYGNAETKSAWAKDVVGAIPALIKQQAGEDYFAIDSIILQKPDIPGTLKADLDAKQSAILRAATSQVDQKTAESWPGGIQAYLAYQQQLAINKAITEGKVQVIPIPQGSGVIVQTQPR